MKLSRELQAEIDYVRAACSGIPRCCARYFVEVWHGGSPQLWRTDAGQCRRTNTHRTNPNFYYIPCDNCLAANDPVRVRDCYPGCVCSMRTRWLFWGRAASSRKPVCLPDVTIVNPRLRPAAKLPKSCARRAGTKAA